MSRVQQEFVRIQQYEGHLRRLIKVKQRNATITKASTSVFKANQNHNPSLPIRKRRVKTENGDISHRQLKISTRSNNLLPLPLIPQSERQLLSNSLNDRKLPGRQAEIVLENYLLSRRILNAKSCIKNSNLKKFYHNQQKYSILRSQSRLSSLHFSQSRLQKFKQFETSQMIDNIKDSHLMGSGRFVFSLKIQQLQKIIRQNSQGKLYNLIIKFNKKAYKFPNLTYKNLTQFHRFNFKKKEAKQSQELIVQIECIVQNNILKFGFFVIDIKDPFTQVKNIGRGESFSFFKQNEIEGIKSIRNDKLIGTVVFDYNIDTEGSNQLL